MKLPSPSGCYAGHLAVTEGVPKPKETVHIPIEGPVVGESKYGLTVPADEGELAAPTALLVCGCNASYVKATLGTEEAKVCGVHTTVAVEENDFDAECHVDAAPRCLVRLMSTSLPADAALS